MAVSTPTALRELSGVQRCLVEIRRMILAGDLLPGQKVHQGDLAEQLKVSRIPVREALAQLHAEGLLVHKPNTGFTVARFNSGDLADIYLMRRLLETELIRSIDLAAVDADLMDDILERMDHLRPAESSEEYQRLNREFHFLLLDPSAMELVRQEVSRLWYISGFYRSLYLYEPEAPGHLRAEHEAIVAAVRAEDVDELIRVSDAHRSGTERLVVQRLGRGRER
ncbi:MAG TPA: GntR family transcriptional regulator [Nocardioides sp.]|jgi:DNA-binding GntR family transcriptional regulator|uniref:GntR family transcriptional regulator n=1 Tax=Nocardioides sp. TaxID=35761 RepID=UPI002E37CFBE|nr:GntR family transcriptional regulator [Nocardioides sp.]HEX3929850.1 GntR family transcriptional regulator [Nocardioides sp.]